jgi:uncharacterized protein
MSTESTSPDALTSAEFDELDTALDDLRTRDDEVPQWEFCEGFMAALVCCRRRIEPAEFMPVLLGTDEAGDDVAPFSSAEQRARFMTLWDRRWSEVRHSLDADVDKLQDDEAYQPEVMDLRAAVASLTDEQRAEMGDAPIPSFGQIWAIGFMYAVENWPEEWEPPRDRKLAGVLDAALETIVALTEDDTDEPTINALDDEGPATMSQRRLNEFADAIYAVYDLRDLWRNIGPQVAQVIKAATPGRNDPCPCGSGQKYKKCCGA